MNLEPLISQEAPQAFANIIKIYNWVGDIGVALAAFTIIGIIICFVSLRARQNKIVISISKFTHSAYGQLLLASAGMFWASIVSVFGSNLQEQWFHGKTWEIENLLFGLPVILALTLSVLHFIYGQIKENQSQVRPSFKAINECSAQSVNIINVVSNCVLDLQKIISAEKNKVGKIISNKKIRENYNTTLENAIKTCMESILLITKKFIEGNDGITVKSNIFNLISSNAAQIEFLSSNTQPDPSTSIFSKESIETSPFFLFSSNLRSRLEHCEYLLVCEQTFTCKLDRKNIFSLCSGSKNDTAPICMPMSYSNNIQNSIIPHPNIFGAPESILNQREVYIENISEELDLFINKLKKSTLYKDHLTGVYEKLLRRYYENDKDKPKSILSIPLRKLDLNSEKLDIPNDSLQYACVLNIYVDRVNFLENELKSEAFYEMIKPLCHSLSAIISLKIHFSNMIKEYDQMHENERERKSSQVTAPLEVVSNG